MSDDDFQKDEALDEAEPTDQELEGEEDMPEVPDEEEETF
jgi:hypothetical protein